MFRKNLRVILLGLFSLILILAIVIFIYFNFLAGGTDVVEQTQPPTPTPEPTKEVVITPEAVTPTPTRVIVETEEPLAEPTEEPTAEPTEEPTTEPPSAAVAANAADFSPTTSTSFVIQIEEQLKNGGFEEGFDETTGVGLNWQSFTNGGASIAFSQETAQSLIYSGLSAQRLSIEHAVETNRYAGIYQTVKVVPDEVYTFSLRGQVRSLFGDVTQSGYGYRVQYAVDHQGVEDWQAITDTAWMELPWGEESFSASQADFSEYTSQITAESNQITLFVRVWNKWADPTLVEYTLDSLSLVGPTRKVIAVASTTGEADEFTTGTTETDEEELIDQPLPVTGIGDNINFMNDGRFWGALLILVFLAGGAVYRAKWRW